MSFKTITAPHINVNDLEMMIAQWHVKPWQFVKKGDLICEIETTKAVMEVEADDSGYIYPLIEECKYAKVGEPLAYLFSENDPKQVEFVSKMGNEDNITVTKKAQTLMKQYGLSIADFPKFSVVSSETVVAKIRELKYDKDFYDEEHQDKLLESIKVDARSVVIYGEQNQALLAIDIFKIDDNFKPIAYIDSSYQSDKFYDLPVMNRKTLKILKGKGLKYIYICGRDVKIRKEQVEECKEIGLSIISCIHPSSIISSTAQLGEGVFIGAQVIIGPDVKIGGYCQVLNGATVAHHSKLEEYVVISDGAHLGGNVSIGKHSLIGIGVNINKRVTVGKNVIVVSGATVIDHVPDNHNVRLDGKVISNKEINNK